MQRQFIPRQRRCRLQRLQLAHDGIDMPLQHADLLPPEPARPRATPVAVRGVIRGKALHRAFGIWVKVVRGGAAGRRVDRRCPRHRSGGAGVGIGVGVLIRYEQAQPVGGLRRVEQNVTDEGGRRRGLDDAPEGARVGAFFAVGAAGEVDDHAPGAFTAEVDHVRGAHADVAALGEDEGAGVDAGVHAHHAQGPGGGGVVHQVEGFVAEEFEADETELETEVDVLHLERSLEGDPVLV